MMHEEWDGLSDDIFVRRVLWDEAPESRPMILELEEEERRLFGDEEEASPGMYSLVSDAFVHPVLIPMLQAKDWDLGAALGAARAIESLLASNRSAIGDLVSLRITDQLLWEPRFIEFVERYGGPRTKAELRDRKSLA
ncbi:hypothetical protein GCM10022206_68250 [Streptomyces chiangmaiensis]